MKVANVGGLKKINKIDKQANHGVSRINRENTTSGTLPFLIVNPQANDRFFPTEIDGNII
jgi:hypothetical protein